LIKPVFDFLVDYAGHFIGRVCFWIRFKQPFPFFFPSVKLSKFFCRQCIVQSKRDEVGRTFLSPVRQQLYVTT
jgi:hypothetical protein